MAETLVSREGKRVPDVAFRIRRNGDWATVTTDDIFGRKNVVVFSLPGAFTPTCSSTHLPRFNELAPAFKAQGIDAIVCVSVNDPFVMEEWGKDQEAQNVFLLADGNGEFTGKMGMLVDKSDLNFGKRSWRYSMLVRDRTIEKMFIEPQEPGDPFEVSDADTMLDYINPDARKPDQVAILTREGCSFCAKAKQRLDNAGFDYAEIPLAHATRSKAVGAIAGARTVPQVFINGRLIGGTAELEAYLRKAA
jgi:glutathione-dependent peroxiredoxin